MTDIVVIGATYFDASFELQGLPQVGATLRARQAAFAPGGKGLNQAIAAKRLGANVTFISTIGGDFLSKEMRRLLREVHHFEDEQLFLHEATGGSIPVVAIATDGEDVRMLAPPRNEEMPSPAPQIERAGKKLRSADAILMTLDYSAELIRDVLDLIRPEDSKPENCGSPLVVLNAAPAANPGELKSSILDRIDWLVPNEWEARCLLGRMKHDDSGSELAERLRSLGSKSVCVTQGSKGCTYFEGDMKAPRLHPGHAVIPIDTTGASDAFCAALAVHLGSGAVISDAIDTACAAGALAAETFGTAAAMPWKGRVESFRQQRSSES